MRRNYDAPGSVLGSGTMVKFCTYHVKSLLLLQSLLTSEGVIDAPYQQGNAGSVMGLTKGLLWSEMSETALLGKQ